MQPKNMPNMMAVSGENPNGQTYRDSAGNPWHYIFSIKALDRGSATGLPSGLPSGLPPVAQNIIEQSKGLLMSPAEQSENVSQYRAAVDEGKDAANQKMELYRFGSTLSEASGNQLAPGALTPIIQSALNQYNSALRLAGLGARQILPNELGQLGISDKLSSGMAALREAGQGQRSFGALKAFIGMTPNTSMAKETALPLVADMFIDNQREIDRSAFINSIEQEASRQNGGLPVSFSVADAVAAFDSAYPMDGYLRERDALTWVLNHGSVMSLINDPNPRKRAAALNRLQQQYPDIPNIGRYFGARG
jgi:hypothetical protein